MERNGNSVMMDRRGLTWGLRRRALRVSDSGRNSCFTGTTTLGASVISQSGDTVTLAGNLRATKQLAAGSQSNFFQNSIAHFSEYYTTTAAGSGVRINTTVDTTGTVSLAPTGVYSAVNTANSATYDESFAGDFRAFHTGTGSLAVLHGLRGYVNNSGQSSVSSSRAVEGLIYQVSSAPGATVDADVFYANGTITDGAVTTWTNFRGAIRPFPVERSTRFTAFNSMTPTRSAQPPRWLSGRRAARPSSRN